MKVTMAIKMLRGSDGSRTFVVLQPPTEKMLQIKKFEAGIAEAVFLEKEKGDDLKSQLKMAVGCFYSNSNVEASFQHFFGTKQPLKELHLLIDGVTLKISRENRDVARLCKQFRQLRVEQKEKKKKQQNNEALPINILEFRNRTLSKQQKLERRMRRIRWIKGVRK